MGTLRQSHYNWVVIGAGPAGIAAAGKLIDSGVNAKKILWLDPEFKVGDFGTLWTQVSSNTQVGLFLKFLNNCQAFQFNASREQFALENLDPKETCALQVMAEPLQWVTQRLREQVNSHPTTVESLKHINQVWEMHAENQTFLADNIILATGSEPRTLNYTGPKTIALAAALNPDKLKARVRTDDVIAVFGSSHSAILVIRHLYDLGVKKIINFYRSPLKYALAMAGWILFDNTGLKGTTAQWAHSHIDTEKIKHLQRHLASIENIERWLPQCDQVIYAIGFERRHKPVITQLGPLTYNARCGIIAPNLFGLGIAFPQAQEDPLGNLEYRVGLWKFMDYLNQVLPIWLAYSHTS